VTSSGDDCACPSPPKHNNVAAEPKMSARRARGRFDCSIRIDDPWKRSCMDLPDSAGKRSRDPSGNEREIPATSGSESHLIQMRASRVALFSRGRTSKQKCASRIVSAPRVSGWSEAQTRMRMSQRSTRAGVMHDARSANVEPSTCAIVSLSRDVGGERYSPRRNRVRKNASTFTSSSGPSPSSGA
jgi:hypothetical protein